VVQGLVVVGCEFWMLDWLFILDPPAFGVGAPKGERPSSLNGRDPAQEPQATSREGTVKGRVGSEAAPNYERGRTIFASTNPLASQPPPASAGTLARWVFWRPASLAGDLFCPRSADNSITSGTNPED